jgi:hypothetical protein
MLAGLHGLPLVRVTPAAGQSDRDLRHPPIVKVQSQWNNRQSLLLDVLRDAPDLLAVEQEFPSAQRIVVLPLTVAIRGDMALEEPEFTILDPCVGLLDRYGTFSDAFHLGSEKHNAALDLLEDFVPVSGLAIPTYAII